MEHRETARAGPTNFRSRDLPRQRRSVSTRSSRAEEVLNYQAIHLGECQLTVSMMIMAVKTGNIPITVATSGAAAAAATAAAAVAGATASATAAAATTAAATAAGYWLL